MILTKATEWRDWILLFFGVREWDCNFCLKIFRDVTKLICCFFPSLTHSNLSSSLPRLYIIRTPRNSSGSVLPCHVLLSLARSCGEQKETVAGTSSRRAMVRPTEISIIPVSRFKDKHARTERTIVWTKPKGYPTIATARATFPATMTFERKVPVVYYLCRNGQLEHPHFMEVPLSSPSGGLFLSDVINRLNLLRGKGMASMYSWSSKRSYKSRFVWHDLADNDFIHPSHGTEYVLKGSEILEAPSPSRPLESMSFRSLKPSETAKSGGEELDFPVVVHRRNQSLTSIDLGEYRVCKTESRRELNLKVVANAATQSIEKQRLRRPVREKEDEPVEAREKDCGGTEQNVSSLRTELSGEEISPPPSDSSPETLGTLMLGPVREDAKDPTAVSNAQCARLKVSSVLMQLISCGSLLFRDCRVTYNGEPSGFTSGSAQGQTRDTCYAQRP